ncbi:hypothetical protein ACPBEH_05615 [Latilactobacillus sp. 5-91]|uniref:hypothetical protein n=1 Tax=Latilactobacillus sp. 5-91 TaxID=3410924 RepID=UPI003C782C07
MVHENDLQLPNWLQLSEQARRANFGQVLRYFVSPLVAIEGIQPEVVQAGRLTFKTYSACFSGEQFVFIPAQSAVSLGWSLGADKLAPSEWFAQTNRQLAANEGQLWADKTDVDAYVDQLTTPSRIVNMPALLVARESVPSGWLAQGRYSPITRHFTGNQLFFSRFQAEIQNGLYRTQPETPLLETAHLVLRLLADQQVYQVFEKTTFTEQQLRQTLRQQGYDFVSVDQYEWLRGAGVPTLWSSGNHLPQPMAESAASFGLDFTADQQAYELTTDPLIYKGGPCVTGGRYQLERQLPSSPFYESGVPTALMGNTDLATRYRRTITVALE